MKKKSKTHPYLRQVHEDILELCGHVSDGKLLSRESLCLPPGQKKVQGHLPAATANCWELKLLPGQQQGGHAGLPLSHLHVITQHSLSSREPACLRNYGQG